MTVTPISVAIKGKGSLHSLCRGVSVLRRYGLTRDKMDRELAQLVTVLQRLQCNATLPITSVTLQRNPEIIRKYQAQGMEFAVHGYRHVDYSQLSHVEQQDQLRLAKQIFEHVGIQIQGFRGPYLHCNKTTLTILQQLDLTYDSSQGLAWDVLNGYETPAYEKVLNFYGALSARAYPSLPKLEGLLVRIPYGLPDDEALVERLGLKKTPHKMVALWRDILRCTYELGELFTLGLHPERVSLCLEPLIAVLTQARSFTPPVWIARLDEIAKWWRARANAAVRVITLSDNRFQVTVEGPPGTTVLARNVQVEAPVTPWANDYQQISSLSFVVQATTRPFICVNPESPARLVNFLRQQGYLVEKTTDPRRYALYIDQTDFTELDERPLLARLEEAKCPLIRLGRWPGGARSALAVTGDIDALTVWDYGLRFLGG